MPSARRCLAALGAAFLLGGPVAAHAQGSMLRVGLPSLPLELDPAAALEGPLPLIARQVFDTLVRYAEAGSDIEPGLASHWSVSRNNLSWTFRLREGVRFHDGTPLAAQHVVDSLERAVFPGHPLAPSGGAAAPRLVRGAPGVIKDVRALDPRTVQINLLLPYAPLLTVLAHPVFSVVLPAAGGPGGARWQGTGAFSIAEMSPLHLALDARPGHWAGGPRLQRIVFVAAPDDGQALAAFDARALDVLLPAGPPPRLEGAQSVPGWRIGYLALQTEKDPLSRVKARRAIAAALDPAVLAEGLGQAAVPLRSFLPPGVWSRREGLPLMQAAPERAKRLLAEAGLPRGASTTLLVADALERLDAERLADAVRGPLGAAGLAAASLLEPPEAAAQMVQIGAHEMAVWEARVEGGDPHFLLYPLSTSEGAVKGPAASNLSFYRNARLDDLLIRGSQISFRPERERLYVRAQGILAEEMPWIPLYARLHWAVARPEVTNLRLHPSGFHRFDRVSVGLLPAEPPSPPAVPAAPPGLPPRAR